MGPASTKILGLNITRYSFTAQHIKQIYGAAKLTLSKLRALHNLDIKSKLTLIKTLIFSKLSYPVTPLNTASPSGFASLQAVQNKALRFAYNINWRDRITSKNLHIRAKLDPINITIHNRAKETWEKIAAGTAAHPSVYERVSGINISQPKRNYPSSLQRALKPIPPPIFIQKDVKKRRIKKR